MDPVAKDKKFVWHPFTQMKDYREGTPVVIEEGDGVRLWDTEGNEYYDGVSSLWVNLHGHRVPEIDGAIRDQLGKIAHSTLLGQGSLPSVELAEQLVEVSPAGLEKVFYSDSGATAVEIAMKMAIQYWANQAGGPTEKKRFITFNNGYHGDTFGPMSVVPDPEFHWPFEPLLPEPVQIDFPRRTGDQRHDLTRLERSLDELDTVLAEREDELAGVMLEPVQGAGGMVVPPDGFIRGVRERTQDRDVFMIVDEVATGFGRTGEMFAVNHEDVTPDIMTLGKGITGGYLPVAATLATDELYQGFLGDRKEGLLHGHSYTGNALGCAAALASLELTLEQLETLPGKIKVLHDQLQPLVNQAGVREVRQKGFMIGVEMEPSAVELPEESRGVGWEVCDQARQRGMLLRPLGPVVVLMPPLASSPGELKEMCSILKQSIQGVVNQGVVNPEK